jgi:hypothetical protein
MDALQGEKGVMPGSQYNPEIHHRHSIRLKGHDYAGGGFHSPPEKQVLERLLARDDIGSSPARLGD